LIVAFKNNVPINEIIINDINTFLAGNIKWNLQENSILFTRSDKKWFKVEIIGISTSLQDGIKSTFSCQQVHAYLRENNSQYAKANIELVYH